MTDDGRVYVADYGNHRIQAFDRTGRLLAAWGGEGDAPGQFRRPRGVAVDGAGRVYVSDSANHRVQVFDGAGRFLDQWGGAGRSGLHFRHPGPLGVDGQGRLYVADDHQILTFDPTGRPLAAWAATDLLDTARPAAGLAVDRQGRVYVSGAGLHVQQFEPTGRLTARWSSDRYGHGYVLRPGGLAVDDDGDVYVADAGGGHVMKFQVLAPVTS